MKGFRTLEISAPSEVHVRDGLLEISQTEQTITVPIEDLITIVCIGSGIRLLTMGLSRLAENGVLLMALDSKYNPSYIVTPIDANARQARIMHRQVSMPQNLSDKLWMNIIRRKIENQARALSIMGLMGADKVMCYIEKLSPETVDYCEAAAAKEYFYHYHPGLNRRSDDPINSRLNYGYAVIRNAIIREIILAGLQPAFGIHHNSQLNTFNLADDLIEPWRPAVDLLAHVNIGSNLLLTKSERKSMASVLHNACLLDGKKISVSSGIHLMVSGLKRCVLSGNSDSLSLPTVIPTEPLDEIKE